MLSFLLLLGLVPPTAYSFPDLILCLSWLWIFQIGFGNLPRFGDSAYTLLLGMLSGATSLSKTMIGDEFTVKQKLGQEDWGFLAVFFLYSLKYSAQYVLTWIWPLRLQEVAFSHLDRLRTPEMV